MSFWGAIGNAVGSLGSIGSRGTPGIRDPRGDVLRKIRNQNRTANMATMRRPTPQFNGAVGGTGVHRSVAGDIVGAIGRGAAGIAEDWIRRRLIPSSTVDTVPGESNLVAETRPKCPDGSFQVLGSPCFDVIPGGSVSGGGMVLSFGEAVMGRFGAALVPAQMQSVTRRCPRGAVLAVDGLCYNKRDLRPSDRAWVPDRKPLLTGGDLNAISRASRAAKKMQRQAKRLQKLGLMPKPKNLAARRAGPRHLIGPVHTS